MISFRYFDCNSLYVARVTFPIYFPLFNRTNIPWKIEENILFKNDARIYLFARFVFTPMRKAQVLLLFFLSVTKKKQRIFDLFDNIEKYADEYLFLLLFAAIALLL